MSRSPRIFRVLLVLVSWLLIVPAAVLLPQAPAASAAVVDESGRDAAGFGNRSTFEGDAPLSALVFAANDGIRDCLYDNTCPEQGGGPGDSTLPEPPDHAADARAALSEALSEVEGKLKGPGWILYPGDEGQVVNLPSFLHITKGGEDETGYGSEGAQSVTVTAVVKHSIWEFTDEPSPITCARTEAWTAGDDDPLCRKDWTHGSDIIGEVGLRVGIEYELTWYNSWLTPASGSKTVTEWSDDEGILTVNEVQTWGTHEDRQAAPPTEVIPEDRTPTEPESISCSWGAKAASWAIPGVGCEAIQLLWDIGTGFLSNCIGAIITRVTDFWGLIKELRDPIGFVKEKVAGLKAMYDLLMEDPKALVEEIGRGFFEIDPDADLSTWSASDWTDWAGGFICGKAFDYLTGKAADAILDILDRRIRGDNDNDSDNDSDSDSGNDDDTDSDDDSDEDSDNEDDDAPTCPTRNSSFPAGTLVLMGDGGLTPIEDIRPGDHVVSHNLDTSVWEPKLVVDQWSHLDRGPPTTANLTNGSTVTATSDHLFWMPNTGEWTELRNVRTGDELLTPEGFVTVDHVTSGPAHQWTVWELTVADNHNFTVLAGDTPVLVHNNDGCDGDLPENWSDDDAAAIADYTGDGYDEINEALRTGEITPEMQARIDAIEAALDKLPDHDGSPVFRGTDLPDSIANSLEEGGFFSDDGFLSTSADPGEAFDGDFQFTIEGAESGVDVSSVSEFPGEAEIVFPPGTDFEITSIEVVDGVTHVTMVEI